jgi:hypothetical protein
MTPEVDFRRSAKFMVMTLSGRRVRSRHVGVVINNLFCSMVVSPACRTGLNAPVRGGVPRLTGCEGLAFLNVPGVVKR